MATILHKANYWSVMHPPLCISQSISSFKTDGVIGLKFCMVLLTMLVSVEIYITLPNFPNIPLLRLSKLQCRMVEEFFVY